jgi:CheY-like chemotaxis protein
VLVENEVLTGGRERESLDTQFGGYKTFYRATPKDLVAGNDFENIERGKHGVTHPSGMSFVPIVRDSGLSRLGHQILDLCMPEMNGFEAATVLQKTMQQVPAFSLLTRIETLHHKRHRREYARCFPSKRTSMQLWHKRASS